MNSTQFHATIRANIKRVRQAKGMTQTELSKAIRHASSYIQRVEDGRNKPMLVTMVKIAEVLRVGIEELLP